MIEAMLDLMSEVIRVRQAFSEKYEMADDECCDEYQGSMALYYML